MQNKPFRHGRGGSDEQHHNDKALFQELLQEHQQIKRETRLIENGIVATTTSDNPHIAKVIQQHVVGMEKRFDMGRAIRSWDPLFAALFEYKDELHMDYKAVKGGIEATLTTNNPKLIELIHAHDATLHGFVNRGFDAGREESPKPSWLE